MSPKSLQQIYEDCLSAAKVASPVLVQNGNLFRWKGCVTSFLIAKFNLQCFPLIGFAVSDSSASIPCVLINPVMTVHKLLNLHHRTILIREPQFVVEVVVTESKQYNLVHVCIEADNVHVVEECADEIEISNQDGRTDVQSEIELVCHELIVVPLKVSSVVLTVNAEIVCLVLALLFYKDDDDTKKEVWLVLENEQVIWKDLLLPNRIYTLHLPVGKSLDCLKSYKSLLCIADKYLDLSFRQMLHHKDLIRTNAAIFLPQDTHLCSNFASSDETTQEWLSISDKRLQSLKFASVYGIIKDVQYIESWKTLSCPWCDASAYYVGEERATYTADGAANETSCRSSKWSMLPNKPRDHDVSINKLVLPKIKSKISANSKWTGFGIRGGKINVQITVQEIFSREIAFVFLKRWISLQYPAGLIEGMVVCFTDVNVKRSKKNNLYFINTPLTRIVHLKRLDELTVGTLMSWGQFGFPNVNYHVEKVWGMLDLDLLAKVSVIATCKSCHQLYYNYRCPNVFCPNNKRKIDDSLYEVTASARLFIRGIGEFEGTSLYLKNDFVRKYLGFPPKVWKHLVKSSAKSQLLYSHRVNETLVPVDNAEDPLQVFFHLYCKHFRSKNRFHVSCKKFKGDASRDRKYFCVEMEQIDVERLSTTRAVVCHYSSDK